MKTPKKAPAALPAGSSARDQRRAEFNRIYEGIAGDDDAKAAKVCAILGYQPGTIRVLRVKKNAWKVIPQSKLDILKRELAREAVAGRAKRAKPAAADANNGQAAII